MDWTANARQLISEMRAEMEARPRRLYLDNRVWDNLDGYWLQQQFEIAGVDATICSVSVAQPVYDPMLSTYPEPRERLVDRVERRWA